MRRMQRRATAQGARRKSRSGDSSDLSVSLPEIIGSNLKSQRTHQGYSLERLAKAAGVSRAMLSQIENGQSVPTILLLLKVANALGVPLAALVSTPASRRTTVLARDKSKVLSASDGRYTLRPLHPADAATRVEFYEVALAGRHSELLDPQPVGTRENFVVVRGRVELAVGREPPVVLAEGDAVYLQAAEVPRSLRNPDASDAILHLVVNLTGTPGG